MPMSCQASVQSPGRAKPQGKPWATASSLGWRKRGLRGEPAKNPCHPLSEGAKVSAARPYDLRMVGMTDAPDSILV